PCDGARRARRPPTCCDAPRRYARHIRVRRRSILSGPTAMGRRSGFARDSCASSPMTTSSRPCAPCSEAIASVTSRWGERMANAYTLDFEKPLLELERQIDELKRVGEERGIDVAAELTLLTGKLDTLRE